MTRESRYHLKVKNSFTQNRLHTPTGGKNPVISTNSRANFSPTFIFVGASGVNGRQTQFKCSQIILERENKEEMGGEIEN